MLNQLTNFVRKSCKLRGLLRGEKGDDKLNRKNLTENWRFFWIEFTF